MFRTPDPRSELLSELTALGDLSGRERRKLARSFDDVTVPGGTVLITEGSVNHHTYFVVSGSLSVRICGAEIATVGPGQPVGERTALGAPVANATVEAAEPTRLLILDNRRMSAIAADHPRVEAALHALINEREAVPSAA
jgi:CRP-like cAMP-binding protein